MGVLLEIYDIYQNLLMSNITHPKIQNLSTLQLKYLYEHLRLGERHLRKILTKKQFKELLSLHYLSHEEKENIYPDKAEKTGNITFIINTIITGIFGAWLGLAAFTELKLTSYTVLLSITSITAVISGVLGYYSFKQVQTEATSAAIKQKLLKLQLGTLNFVNRKYNRSIATHVERLNSILNELDNNISPFDKTKLNSQNQLAIWFKTLIKFLEKEEETCSKDNACQIFAIELHAIKNNLEKIISSTKELRQTEQKSDPDYLDILSASEAATSKQPAARRSWIKGNISNILINLIPVLIGSFGSMFVFLTGTPNLSKEFGAYRILNAITNPTARKIEFFLAIIVTLYYGFSNVYNFRKTFKRNDELEKAQKQITNQETETLKTNETLSVLKRITNQIKRLKTTHNMLQTIANHGHF